MATKYTKLYEVARVLNFADRIILNTHMYVFEQQKQIGTRLFYNQVVAARKHKFYEIQTTAMGKEDGDNWTGFYAWGRLGYQMILGDEEKFRRLMEKEKRIETNLGSFVNRGRENLLVEKWVYLDGTIYIRG